jgi:putative endonuclease
MTTWKLDFKKKTNNKMQKGGCIYIMTNTFRTTVYIGVTSNLEGRIWEHKNKVYPKSFTAKYNLNRCVYYECFFTIQEAISREKELKAWRRSKKNELINQLNPYWEDLYNQLIN